MKGDFPWLISLMRAISTLRSFRAISLKVNVDECGDLAQRYGIMSIPNMVFFKGGQPVDRVVGAIPKPAMKQKFDKNI